MSSAATSQFQKSRPIAAIAFPATSLAEFVESWRTLKRGLFDHYRPELHYMRGPGPKWREKHIAHGVEDCANHPTYARSRPRKSGQNNSRRGGDGDTLRR
jgi:hypothetical protein